MISQKLAEGRRHSGQTEPTVALCRRDSVEDVRVLLVPGAVIPTRQRHRASVYQYNWVYNPKFKYSKYFIITEGDG